MEQIIRLMPEQADRDETMLHHQGSYCIKIIVHVCESHAIFENKDQMFCPRARKSDRECGMDILACQTEYCHEVIHNIRRYIPRECLRRLQSRHHSTIGIVSI